MLPLQKSIRSSIKHSNLLKVHKQSQSIHQTSKLSLNSTSIMQSTNQHGQGASHATGNSIVPDKVQDVAPEGLEKSLPDSVHDTSSSTSGNQGAQSHATGPSKVPEAIQKVAPKGLEKALPESIHPTN